MPLKDQSDSIVNHVNFVNITTKYQNLRKSLHIYINFSISKLTHQIAGLILGLCPANERRRYKVTPSLIDWTQT